jgi:hypothetical protein
MNDPPRFGAGSRNGRFDAGATASVKVLALHTKTVRPGMRLRNHVEVDNLQALP